MASDNDNSISSGSEPQQGSSIKAAAAKKPTNEAALHLKDLLGTVGDAGLGEITLPPRPQEPESEAERFESQSDETEESSASSTFEQNLQNTQWQVLDPNPVYELAPDEFDRLSGEESNWLSELQPSVQDFETKEEQEPEPNSIEAIVLKLGMQAEAWQFEEASKALEKLLKEGENEAAPYLLWSRAAESCQRMNEAIENRNLDEIESVKATADVIKAEMDKLFRQARRGNTVARRALLRCLVDEKEFREDTQEKEAPDINLTGLSSSEQFIVKEHAVLSLHEALIRNPDAPAFTKTDCRELASAAAAAQTAGNKNLESALSAFIETLLKGKNKKQFIAAILETFSLGIPGAAKLSLVLQKLYSQEALTEELSELLSLAEQGAEGALRTLILVLADEISEKAFAFKAVLKAATIESNRDKILMLMLDEYEDNGDRGVLLACLGRVAVMDRVPNYLVLETLRQSFEKEISEAEKPAFNTSTLEGFISLAEFWREEDLDTLSLKLNPQLMSKLPQIFKLLPKRSQKRFLSTQHQLLFSKKRKQQVLALQAFTVLADYLQAENLRDVAYLCTKIQEQIEEQE
ncbi:MAG: hypothetical protein K2X27_20650, partial [Candidatus Obscuribacterales bacterium]|nr:hypothetical protein [Candidatus Obscuribacterales bacterium]